MKTIDVSIIIVSFNTRNLTLDSIRSIEKTVKKSTYEIIVVDNNSSDGSVEEIEELCKDIPELTLIKNKENVGFSRANNIGIKKSHGRYVLFLNSDTIVYEKTIDGMVTFMDENPDCGASTCFLRMPSGALDDASHRGFPTPWRAFSHFSGLSKIFSKSKLFSGYSMTYVDITKTHEIDALAGAFMLVARSAGEEIGWWDEDYFFYGEDLDFSYRLKQRGWKIYFMPDYEILHYKGASGGIKNQSKGITTADKKTKMKAQEERFRAMKLFYNKNYKNKYPKVVRNMVFWGIGIKKLISSIRS